MDERINDRVDRQNSWKKTEEIEIDLADMVRKLCMQWKRIAVCALASAVILGGFGLLKSRESRQDAAAGMAEELELTPEEIQRVEDAVRLAYEINGLESYMEHSALMQLDAYHKPRYIMLYKISRAGWQELQAVTESYLNFLLNGGAADALIEADKRQGTDKSCVAELILAYQRTYSFPYQFAVGSSYDSSRMESSIFYVEVTGKNAKEAQSMALKLQKVLENYSQTVKKTAGSHRLALINSMESVTADSALMSQQHEKNALLSSDRMSLKAMTDAFSAQQMALYEETAGIEEKDGQAAGQQETEKGEAAKEKEGDTAAGERFRAAAKYIVFGFAGGICAYGLIFVCWYIFRDTVKSTEEMRRLYTIPVYGGICVTEKKRKASGFWMREEPDAYGQTQVQTLNRIRLGCTQQGIEKLCAVSDFSFSKAEKEYLENMAGQLESWGISMETEENASANPACWDGLVQTGAVLLVCRIGTTTHRMIDNAMNFYLENGILAVGMAVFLQGE